MSRKLQQILRIIGKACQDETLTEAEIEKIFQERSFFVELGYEGFGKDMLAQRGRFRRRFDVAGGLTGTGSNGAPTRWIGASRESKASSWIRADSSAPKPPVVTASCATTARPVRRTGRAVVAHEAVVPGGFGAELTAQIQQEAFDCLQAPIQRVGAPFEPVPVSPPLEDDYRPGAPEIHAAARTAIEWDWPEEPRP